MLRMIKLTKISQELRGEDDLEQAEVRVVTDPIMINVDEIREFYPRTNGRPGTRVVFKNGAGWPVTETFDMVEAAISGTNN